MTRFLFGLIMLVYLVAGGLYAVLTPPWQAPDEPAHYNYVRYLATETGFPELASSCYNQAYLDQLTSRGFPPELSVDHLCYEFYQPPLYYLLAAPVFRLGNGSLLGLRLLSVALGAGVVAVTFMLGRTIFPLRPSVAYAAMALVAFVPMHGAILASVNNDALAELILAGLLLLLVRRLLGPAGPSWRDDLLLGGLLGLGLITKFTVYVVALPLVAVALALAPAGRDWRSLAQPALSIYGLALLIVLPWYVRNMLLYGSLDILGMGRHNQVVVGQLRTADFLASTGWGVYLRSFVTTTFQSFWGQFGWMAVPMDGRTYLALLLLSLAALAGLIIFLARPQPALAPGQRRAVLLLGLAVGLMLLAYVGYNLNLVQFQGRYLFPVLPPLALLCSLGLHEVFETRRSGWLAGGLAAAGVASTVTGLQAGHLDKLALVLMGLAVVVFAGRAWLARSRSIPATWLVAAGCAGLGILTLASPFWFVVPYLPR